MKKMLTVLSLLPSLLFAQPYSNLSTDADQYFNAAVKKMEIPGLAVVIVKGNETLLAKGYGYADLENKVPASSNTNYYIASSTKSFTGLLATMLDVEGVIELDQSLQHYLPNVKPKDIDLSTIKIRDLLTHTSGIDNIPIAWRVAFTGEHNQAQLMQLLTHCTANKAGYGNYQYTNVGYNIYAIILEKVTGKSWKDWMQEKIFTPAGMQHTSAYISDAEKGGWPLARPYNTTDGMQRIALEKQDNTMQSAGGLIITPNDMATWLKLQLNDGRLDGKQVIAEKTMALSQQKLVSTPTSKRIFEPTNYGMGWLFGTHNSAEVVHHFGGFAGFSTHVSYMPEQQIGVAIMVNDAFSGGQLMSLLANSTYDYLLSDTTTPAFDEKGLADFVAMANQYRDKMVAGIAERNKRTWMLSKPFVNYSGKYHSDLYGNLTIKGDAKGLQVTHGNMHCTATPYVQEETMRVELVPGSGEVIQVTWENEEIVGLIYGDMVFDKVK